MKSLIFAVLCGGVSVSSALAGTITFDGAPTDVDLGSYYQGVTFGAGNQATQQMLPYLPAYSGTEALSGSGTANTISFDFATAQTSFSFYYVSYLGFSGVAYDANGNIVGMFSGIGNYNVNATLGNPSTYSTYAMTGLTTGTADITSVVLTATAGSSAFTFVDNLSAPGISGLAVPDATNTLALLGAATVGLITLRRKFGWQ
jgi:hypothetical protein